MKKKKINRAVSRVTVINLTRRRIPETRLIRRIIKKVFESERESPEGLTVTYVTDAQIKKLNLEYRGRERLTDVLAFSAREGREIEGSRGYLGDIVISLDAARRQAKRFGSTIKRELKLYLIHGALHLLGYDDETGQDALREMREAEEALIGKV
ncbi:MAG: rRNA maturation RNase YbeY [Candidatus Omnitrophota bacterium]